MTSLCDAKAAIEALARLDGISFASLQSRSCASLEMLESYKRFLALKTACADYYASLLAPTPEVDAIWCAHLLDTISYHETCALIASGQFIHRVGDVADQKRRDRALSL